MFRKVGSGFAAGIALTLSFPSSSWADGLITFTADNAAEIFINGESLGQTDNWTKPVEFDVDKANLQQGSNVIGIAAFDAQGIAAMSGQFVMPDGTKFGTNAGWIAFPADKNPGPGNQPNNPYDGAQKNPLKAYEDILDIPPGWNTVDNDILEGTVCAGKKWRAPGYVNEKGISGQYYPWGTDTTGDPTWLWIGENNSVKPGFDEDTELGDWYVNNFVLFRFEFICADGYCNSDVGWEENQLIDIDSRSYDDVIGSSSAGLDANTYPYFAGGTLSFEGFAGGEYESDFYLDDHSDTINNAGVDPELTGVLSGPGGMIFKGKGVTALSGTNTYGPTSIQEGTLVLQSSRIKAKRLLREARH